MKKIVITPESLWRKYIQARPDSIERAGYGHFKPIAGPEIKYEAKCGKDSCYLTVKYSGEYPSLHSVVFDIEERIKKERKDEFDNINKLSQEKFFEKMRKLQQEAWERFEKTKENIPEYRRFLEINEKWYKHVSSPLLSEEKPLISSIPCAELEFRPFAFSMPEQSYNKWITHLKFSEFLKKLRTPSTSFPEVGDSISYSLYTSFSGNFNGVNAERGLTLRYKDSTFNFSSDEKQQEN
jgi:hypothetical protein